MLTRKTKILDFGSSEGSHINEIVKNTKINKHNVYIADIDKNALNRGRKKFGFKTILIRKNSILPFRNKYFDIVYSNSVIEHVTHEISQYPQVEKKRIWKINSNKEFRKNALKNQNKFAKEIIRLGKNYFVQTPYKHFPIESHSWLPFVQYLPRPILISSIKILNLFWIKKTQPDWNLLLMSDMKKFFPDSKIIQEKRLGFIKSIMSLNN